MGEEKPDEELMGKRKSSPRLSPAPLGAGTIIVTRVEENIRTFGKKHGYEVGTTRMLYIPVFCTAADYGNITEHASDCDTLAQNDQGLKKCESYPVKPRDIR